MDKLAGIDTGLRAQSIYLQEEQGYCLKFMKSHLN